MGHIRLGRLPKKRGWTQVISLLSDNDSTLSEIAESIAQTAKIFFNKQKNEPGLVFYYWLLTQITYRARSEDFVSDLRNLNIDIADINSSFDFFSRIINYSQDQIKSRGSIFPLSEIAQLSFRELLSETIGQECKTLFGTTIEDIRLACKNYSTPNQFGKLSRLFFTKIINRTLQFFISKESPNRIGCQRKFKDITDLSFFNDELESYCYQSAKIVEDFAKGWYSKRNWQGEISEHDARGFVAVAMQKLRDEIAHEETKADGEL